MDNEDSEREVFLDWASKRNHYDQIIALCIEAFRENHGKEPGKKFMRRLHWALPKAVTGQGERTELLNPKWERVKIFRDEDHKVLGVIWWTKSESETSEPRAYIRVLSIHKDFRGQGLATKLFKYAAEFCQGRGIKQIESCVYMKNAAAYGFAKDHMNMYPERIWFRLPLSDSRIQSLGGMDV